MNEHHDRKPEECTIAFAGDLLCPAELTECTGGNYEICFEKIAPYLKKADLAVANLETPVAGEDLRYTYEKYRFNTPESYLTAIKSAGILFVSCAMNHCMDRGEIGIDRTLDNCRAAGLETTGMYKTEADRDKISVKNIGGIKVAFVNYTYGTNAFAHRTFLRNGYKVNLLQPEETLDGSIHLLNSPEQIEADVKRIYSDEKEKYAPIVNPYLNRLERDIKEAKNKPILSLCCSTAAGNTTPKSTLTRVSSSAKSRNTARTLSSDFTRTLYREASTRTEFLRRSASEIFCPPESTTAAKSTGVITLF